MYSVPFLWKCDKSLISESKLLLLSYFYFYLKEPTYVKILEEIPEVLNKHGKPANTKVYETWEAFQNAFLAQGKY